MGWLSFHILDQYEILVLATCSVLVMRTSAMKNLKVNGSFCGTSTADEADSPTKSGPKKLSGAAAYNTKVDTK
jgi:hypothetical protein